MWKLFSFMGVGRPSRLSGGGCSILGVCRARLGRLSFPNSAISGPGLTSGPTCGWGSKEGATRDTSRRDSGHAMAVLAVGNERASHRRAHPDLNQGPADLQSAALTTELCTHMTSLSQRARGCSMRITKKAGVKKISTASNSFIQCVAESALV